MNENASWRLTQQTILLTRQFIDHGFSAVDAHDGPLAASHALTDRIDEHARLISEAGDAHRRVVADTRQALSELDALQVELDAAGHNGRAGYDAVASAVDTERRAEHATSELLEELQHLRNALGSLRGR